jgi:hypothetical protein
MRRAIEKITFSLLSLAVASLFTFVMLARITDGLTLRPASLPLLFNAAPRNVRDLSLTAADRVARGGAETETGRIELERLGGAAFPHVLPHLDALEPRARGRVAMALGPVALRMGVAETDDVDTPERAIGYFTRFWQDRSADFRGAAVKRKVSRLAERALPLRRKEVTELDTFALPELLAAIGTVHTQDDVQRIARLVPVITHLTGLRLELPPEASVERARKVVTELRAFAFEHAADFSTLDGPARVSATVTQTRYFRWLAATARSLGPYDPVGHSLMRRVLREAASSLPLGVVALVAAGVLVLGVERLLRRLQAAAPALGASVIVLAGVPVTVVALAGAGAGRALSTLGLVVALAAALAVELRARRGTDYGAKHVLARAGALLPIAVAAELAVEAVLGRGLGAVTRRALALGDLTTLMWAALPVAVLGMIGVALSDLDGPRAQRIVTELDTARRHPRALFVLAGWLGLLLLFALLGPALTGPASLPTSSTIATGFVALAVAGTVGVVWGVLAGGLSRTADVALARSREVIGAMPQPLVTCAALTLGPITGAASIALLRSVEVADTLSRKLNERRMTERLEAPSRGGTPLAPYLTRVFPYATRATAVTLALSVPWILGLEAAARALYAVPLPSLVAVSAQGATVDTIGTAVLLFVAALGASVLLFAIELTPREVAVETPTANVVFALKRRVGSASSPRILDDAEGPLDEGDGAR